MAIEIICEECGGDDVRRDAWAKWDLVQQTWLADAVFDDGYCMTCDQAVHLVERPVLTVVEGGR